MDILDSIKLYQPVALDELRRYEHIIGSALFGMADKKMGNMQFYFDNYGHLSFIDGDRLLSEKPFPCSIKDAKAAQELAEMYMAKANKKLDEYFSSRKIDFPQIFPPSKNVAVKPPSITPIIHPKTNQTDHWLCRYFLLLRPSFNEPFVPVFNAELQLRIGGKGNLVGLYYYWRPILQSKGVKRHYLFIETPSETPAPIIASTESGIKSYMLSGKTYNPNRISEAPELAYYYEEGSSFVAPYFLGFSEENQIFVPASEYSKSILPSIDFTPPYDKLKKILEKLTGVKFPELPSDKRLTADWQAMYLCWFFETKPELNGATWKSDTEVEFDYNSSYCLDIKNSVSMKEVKEKFLSIASDRPNPYGPKPFNGKTTGFQFSGPGSGIPNYYSWVEWFIGSYNVTVDWIEILPNKFEVDIFISNMSGWYSGTRLPKTWQNKLKSSIGIEMTNLVDDAPRGETIKRKLDPRIVLSLESLRVEIPSFGGNFWQYFRIKDIWEK